jgi:hypothetical protein
MLIVSAERLLFFGGTVFSLPLIHGYTASWNVYDNLYTDSICRRLPVLLATQYSRYISHKIYCKLENLRHSVYWSCLNNLLLFGGILSSLHLTHGILQAGTSATLCVLIVPAEHLSLFGSTVFSLHFAQNAIYFSWNYTQYQISS